MSRIACRLASWLPESIPLLSRLADRHRERCRRCQADQARLRGVTTDLSVLEDEVVRAPGGLHTQVMATLPVQDAADPRRPLVMRLVARWVTGIGVAVATLVAIITRQARKRN